jgi:hypothetical protein
MYLAQYFACQFRMSTANEVHQNLGVVRFRPEILPRETLHQPVAYNICRHDDVQIRKWHNKLRQYLVDPRTKSTKVTGTWMAY